jgi:pimeloyl-ACP methyl ester carboxylesterase
VAYDFRLLGDDLDAVIDAVARGRRVHLIGHDWGGVQGWEFATSPRFAGRLASFTAVAAPSLDQVSLSGTELLRRGRLLKARVRARRSWYILVLLMPGGPQFAWRLVLGGQRWRRALRTREGIPEQLDYPGPTVTSDAVNGANLYRRNIPRRTVRPRRDAIAHVPVQLIVPERDRFIPPEYYERAERHVPILRRRSIDTTHWAQLTHPDEVAQWIREFVAEIEQAA